MIWKKRQTTCRSSSSGDIRPYLNALEQLAEGIDLDALVTWSGETRQELQSQVEQLNALAQLGITVEIVGHELETIDADIARHLARFPNSRRWPHRRSAT